MKLSTMSIAILGDETRSSLGLLLTGRAWGGPDDAPGRLWTFTGLELGSTFTKQTLYE